MASQTLKISGMAGDEVVVDLTQLESLGDDDRRLLPGQPGFKAASRIWNGLVTKEPGLVVQPISVDEVVEAVNFARANGVLLGIKGGGHNIAGLAIAENGLLLDMSRMRDVRVDADNRLVHVGPGCQLGDVDRETQAHGLATVLGFVSETGVAGLTLGGGFGYLTRRFGFTVDNLVEVEIVTADGEVRKASRDDNEDLFWALRGGGGNFGVVTEFTFRLHEVGPHATGGLIGWSAEHADDVMDLYMDVTSSAPRELTIAIAMRLAPPAPFLPAEWHGQPIVAFILCHTGDPDQAEKDLAAIRGFGNPIADVVEPKMYSEQQAMLDATQPKGLNYYWKTEFIPEMTPAYADVLKKQAAEITSPMSQLIAFHLEGAVNEFDEDDGAVGNRDAKWVTGAAGCWPPDDPNGETHIAWVRDTWERILPFSTGGNYINFQMMDDDSSRIHDSYRGNYERLRRVKAEYDPGNLFRVNRNIDPAT